jgi:hypothetical protein
MGEVGFAVRVERRRSGDCLLERTSSRVDGWVAYWSLETSMISSQDGGTLPLVNNFLFNYTGSSPSSSVYNPACDVFEVRGILACGVSDLLLSPNFYSSSHTLN